MNIIKTIDKYMLTYSHYTIYNRAIPSLLDGLKPSQRMIMEVAKNITSFEKSNTVAGKVMLVHAHGDCYPTIVGMIQEDNNNIPLLLGKGSFSSRTTRDGAPASSRYTECKISPFGKTIVGNKDELELIPSYDGKAMIPTSFSPDFPLILLNGSLGIATGFATNIPQYNLNEICEQTIRLLEGEKYQHIFPDFSTGGYIHNVAPTDDSSMKYTLRGKCKIKGNSILITEIPYNTTIEDIIGKVTSLYKEGKLSEIKNIKDLTDRKGLLIKVDLKKGANAEEILNKLYALTPVQTTYTTNIGYIYKNKLMYSGIEDLLKNWIDEKTSRILLGAERRLKKINEELEIVDGLLKTKDDIKWLGEFILHAEGNIEESIVEKYNITKVAAEYITNLGIKYFRTSYFEKKIKEGENLLKEKANLENIIKTNGEKELIRRLKDTMKKFGSPRKTQITELITDKVEVTKEIEDFKGYITITKKGYIFKTKTKTTNTSLGDEIISCKLASNDDQVLYFTKDGSCYKYYVEDIKVMSNKDIGQFTGLEDIVGAIHVTSEDNKIIKVYEGGRAVLECIDNYKTATKRKKLGNSLYLGADLLDVRLVSDDDSIEFLSPRNHKKVVKIKDMTIKKARDSQGTEFCKNAKEYKFI